MVSFWLKNTIFAKISKISTRRDIALKMPFYLSSNHPRIKVHQSVLSIYTVVRSAPRYPLFGNIHFLKNLHFYQNIHFSRFESQLNFLNNIRWWLTCSWKLLLEKSRSSKLLCLQTQNQVEKFPVKLDNLQFAFIFPASLKTFQLLDESFDQRLSLKLFRQSDRIENQIPSVLGKINLNRTQVS